MHSQIKAVLFDADGVINHASMTFSSLLNQKYGLSQEATRDFFRGPFQDCLVGKLDMREVLPEYLEKWGWKKSLDDFISLWFSSEHAVEKEIIEDVLRLRKSGIRCYVATNNEKHRANYMLEKMDFKNHFDGMYASAHMGTKKPEESFFKKILGELNLKPEQVLFWDDDRANIAGASRLGIHSEFFEGLAHYREIMHVKYGLL